MNELIKLGFDIYAYVTFTTPNITNLDYRINSFVEKLVAGNETRNKRENI